MSDTPHIQETGAVPETGLIGRMAQILFSPGKVFTALNTRVGHADWLVPMLVVVLVTLISIQFTMPVIQAKNMAQLQAQMEKNENLTPEKRAQTLETVQKVGNIGALVGAPLGAAGWMLIQAAVLLLLANFILGGKGNFKKTLAVVAYSSLVAIPGAIVTIPLIRIKETLVQVGPGLLLPDSMEGTFAYSLLAMLNIFSIWQYALIAIGLAIVSGISTKRATYGVFTLLVIFSLIAAGLQTLATAVGTQ